jgi:hypothetical protein
MLRVTTKTRIRWLGALAILAALGWANAGFAAIPGAGCDQVPQGIPQRPADASTAASFVQRLEGLSEDDREAAIAGELLAGNIPPFLRRLAPIRLTGQTPNGRTVHVTFCALPDYLAIGSGQDFLLVPMRLQTALMVASHYGFLLPTRKMVDAIYDQASLRLAPQPLPAGAEMRSTDYYRRHNQLIAEQRSRSGGVPGALTAGDKKDLVLTNRLWQSPQSLAIYGWHRAVASPIQPLSTVHGARYVDYSHGVRLVAPVAYVDGEPKALAEILQDAQLASVLSDEGALRQLAALWDLLQIGHTVPGSPAVPRQAPSHSTPTS